MQRYVFAACVERVPAGGFSLFFPDLSGCITAADDMMLLAARAREALELHLEGMLEEGLPIPQATAPDQLRRDAEVEIVATLLVEATPAGREQVVLDLSPETLRRADAAASARGSTRSRVLEEQLEGSAAA